ncbi:MAG: hypothetical protein KatS3mg001_585 [Candidatus Pacearchaeota archaeon]|nr:MAG: hypothetical protein KatS3mg001_585 [Candidatus Pacearchaeota archaeon]
MFKNIFLKPTKTHLILSFLILIVFIPFINYDNGIRCIKAPCNSSSNGSVLMWLFFSYNFHVYSINYIVLIVGIVLSYLFTFLILKIFLKKNY